MAIHVLSSAFREGEAIPSQYTCDGHNVSPPLHWEGIPKNAMSIALICDDPDAPSGDFIHWILFNLHPSTSELPERLPAGETVPKVGTHGRSSFNRIGYGGPCPPPGKPHRYYFRLYALDAELDLRPGCTKDELTGAMEGHIIEKGELMGIYKRGER